MSSEGPAARRDLLDDKAEAFPPDIQRRIDLTVVCNDSNNLPRVPEAGQIMDGPGGLVQVMHNGLLVRAFGYYGSWMAEIIRRLRGVHEPQEEKVFADTLSRLHQVESPATPVMVELGSFWGYYSLWFKKEFPTSSVILLEPDPQYLEVGKDNFEINQEEAEFVHGMVGEAKSAADLVSFRAESTGEELFIPSFSLESLLNSQGQNHADLVLADIQGAETVLLKNGRDFFASGAVRFLFVSTHDMSISGSPTTHQQALQLIQDCGGHIIAEHTVTESFSGDGLIVASFREADRDFHVQVSFARAKDSLFGEWEPRVQELLTSKDEDLAPRENPRAIRGFAEWARRLMFRNQRLIDLDDV